MKLLLFSQLKIALLCGLLVLGGCANNTTTQPRLPYDSIAVVPAQYPPQAALNAYARGKSSAFGEQGMEGAASGAAAGAIQPFFVNPAAIIAWPIILPFTIIGGAIVGGVIEGSSGVIHGLSANEAEKVSDLVDQALHQLGIQEQLSKRVANRALQAGMNAELLLEAGPNSPKEEKSYSELGTNYGAVLELTVDNVGMYAHKGEPPRVALEMKMHARIVCFGDIGVSGIKQLEWSGHPRSLTEWAEGGGDLLAADFEEGYETLAQYVWEMIFPDLRDIDR